MQVISPKLIRLYENVSIWGVKGVLDYFARMIRPDPLRSFFVENARKYPYSTSETGITLIGPLTKKSWSLSKVLRDFAFSLKDAGIPFQTFDTGPKETHASDTEGILTDVSDFRIRRYSHVVEMLFPCPLPNGIVDHRARIAFWEFNEGIADAFHCLDERDEPIIAMSDFNYGYFKKEFEGQKRIFKVLYPLRMEISSVLEKKACRAKFGLGLDDFVVFYNFSYSSGWWRKNPLDAVRAFARAFPTLRNARLVLKTANAHRFRDREEQLLALAEEVGVRDRLILFNEWMSQLDLYNLTNACDVYLSLHRAEGFGLGLAEAMCLGKPVICTDYSAPTEFCTKDHCIPVPFEMVELTTEQKKSSVWYRGVRQWAAPDVEAAAESLVKLQNNESLRLQLGTAARDYVRTAYSVDRFRESVLSFLQDKAGA